MTWVQLLVGGLKQLAAGKQLRIQVQLGRNWVMYKLSCVWVSGLCCSCCMCCVTPWRPPSRGIKIQRKGLCSKQR
jgi:hypothetical protein